MLLFINFFLVKRLEFEKRRKLHYNEFEAVRRARKLMEDEGDDDGADTSNSTDNNMDVDDIGKPCTSSTPAAVSSSSAASASLSTLDTHV